VRAWRLEPLPTAAEPAAMAAMPEVQPADAARDDAAVLVAVARDPFRPDRRHAPGRYRLPGEVAVAAPLASAPAYAPPTPPAALRALGTIVLPDGRGLAAVAGASGRGRVLRVGQTIDGFQLVRVAPGEVTLRGADTTLVLRTPAGGTP
jgi:hypothetical protein